MITMPERFTSDMNDSWSAGSLQVTFDDGLYRHDYLEVIKQRLLACYTDQCNSIKAYGYSIADAVCSLNILLNDMGIHQVYNVAELSTDHDTRFEYTYVRAWEATHTPNGDEAQRKRKFINRRWFEGYDCHKLVQADLERLSASRIRDPFAFPREHFFQVGKCRTGLSTLWVTEDYSRMANGQIIVVEARKEGLKTQIPIHSRVRRARNGSILERSHVVIVRPDNAIITKKSFQYAERHWGNLVIPVYRVDTIHKGWAFCLRTNIEFNALPPEIREQAEVTVTRIKG